MSIVLARQPSAPYQPVYPTFREAQLRVELLKRFGFWPGIRSCGDGFTLTHDIKLSIAEIKHGLVS